jgi:formate hydrogenlyase subunit 3/multisubunit Na+/H+ antiporter MnhD subunit
LKGFFAAAGFFSFAGFFGAGFLAADFLVAGFLVAGFLVLTGAFFFAVFFFFLGIVAVYHLQFAQLNGTQMFRAIRQTARRYRTIRFGNT